MIEAVFASGLLSTASLAAMLTPVIVPGEYAPFQEPAYGLGVMLDGRSSYGTVAGHGGGGPGYSIGAFHFENVWGRRVTSVALANGDAGDIGVELAFGLVNVFASGVL